MVGKYIVLYTPTHIHTHYHYNHHQYTVQVAKYTHVFVHISEWAT